MNTVLFDLDGTLLPMDTQAFMEIYGRTLCAAFPELEPKPFLKAIFAGVDAMQENDGSKTNALVFAETFQHLTGLDFSQLEDRFLQYYSTLFQSTVQACRPSDLARQITNALLEKGYTVVIATNPIFPRVATYARLYWLGLDPRDFALVTTYEDSRTSKPNSAYFLEVCRRIGKPPEDCVHIGNNVHEDGAAREVGIPVMLVEDCLINRRDLPMEGFWRGSLQDVLDWAKNLPSHERNS